MRTCLQWSHQTPQLYFWIVSKDLKHQAGLSFLSSSSYFTDNWLQVFICLEEQSLRLNYKIQLSDRAGEDQWVNSIAPVCGVLYSRAIWKSLQGSHAVLLCFKVEWDSTEAREKDKIKKEDQSSLMWFDKKKEKKRKNR